MPLADAEKLVPHAESRTVARRSRRPAREHRSMSRIRISSGRSTRSSPRCRSRTGGPISGGISSPRVEPWLDSRFVDEDFRMESILTGTNEMLPRWKRCVRVTDQSMGEALGQAYVARTFPPEAKARALAMVRNMEAVLREDLGTLAWMSPATRAQAITKLDAFTEQDRVPRHVARLLRADHRTAAVHRKRDRRRGLRVRAPHRQDRPSARIARNGRCRRRRSTRTTTRSINEVVFPAGHPAAAVLRSQGAGRGQLRRHWHRHRSRDDTRLRRPGPEVRRAGQSATTGGRRRTRRDFSSGPA